MLRFQLFRTQWLGKAYTGTVTGINRQTASGFQLFRTQWLGKVKWFIEWQVQIAKKFPTIPNSMAR